MKMLKSHNAKESKEKSMDPSLYSDTPQKLTLSILG